MYVYMSLSQFVSGWTNEWVVIKKSRSTQNVLFRWRAVCGLHGRVSVCTAKSEWAKKHTPGAASVQPGGESSSRPRLVHDWHQVSFLSGASRFSLVLLYSCVAHRLTWWRAFMQMLWFRLLLRPMSLLVASGGTMSCHCSSTATVKFHLPEVPSKLLSRVVCGFYSKYMTAGLFTWQYWYCSNNSFITFPLLVRILQCFGFKY